MAFPTTHGGTPNEPLPKQGQDQAHSHDRRIDLNHASKEDIISAAGLDRDIAEKILHYRDQRSGFETWRDFDEIPIPPDQLDKLRPHVRL